MVRIVELQLGSPFASRARKLRLIIWLIEFRVDGALESSQTSLSVRDQVTQKRSADSVHDRAGAKLEQATLPKRTTLFGSNSEGSDSEAIRR